MADRVFRLGIHLAKSQRFAIGEKHRIIAKKLVAARRPHQMAEYLALENFGLAIRPGDTVQQ